MTRGAFHQRGRSTVVVRIQLRGGTAAASIAPTAKGPAVVEVRFEADMATSPLGITQALIRQFDVAKAIEAARAQHFGNNRSDPADPLDLTSAIHEMSYGFLRGTPATRARSGSRSDWTAEWLLALGIDYLSLEDSRSAVDDLRARWGLAPQRCRQLLRRATKIGLLRKTDPRRIADELGPRATDNLIAAARDILSGSERRPPARRTGR